MGNEFIKSLDNPLGIWGKSFNTQISESGRMSLFLLLSHSGPVILPDFKLSLEYFNKVGLATKGIDIKPIYYKRYIKELENSFIKVNLTDKHHHFIDFQNPSIKDFLLNIILGDEDIVRNTIIGEILTQLKGS